MIEIIQQIKQTQEIATKDKPEDWRVWAGFEMAKQEAIRNLEGLKKKLAEAVMAIAVPVLVNGPNATELAEAMKEQTPSAVIDLNKLVYGKVAETIKPTIGRSREFGVGQFSLLINTVRQMALDSGLAGIEIPKFGEPVVIQNDQDLTDQVSKYMAGAVGVELAKQVVAVQTSAQALETVERKVTVFPVFLLNVKDDIKSGVVNAFKRPEISLTANEAVTEEVAVEALKTIKKTLKKD